MARPDVALWCTKVHKLWAFGRGRWYSGGFRLEYVATKNKLILYYVFPGHSACGRARGGGSAAMKLPRRSQDTVLASFAAAPATMRIVAGTALTVCQHGINSLQGISPAALFPAQVGRLGYAGPGRARRRARGAGRPSLAVLDFQAPACRCWLAYAQLLPCSPIALCSDLPTLHSHTVKVIRQAK